MLCVSSPSGFPHRSTGGMKIGYEAVCQGKFQEGTKQSNDLQLSCEMILPTWTWDDGSKAPHTILLSYTLEHKAVVKG